MFRNLKALGQKHGLFHKPVRSDDGFPMGARIGGIVSFQSSPFLRNQGPSFVRMPERQPEILAAVSRITGLVDGDDLYRLYLDKGDLETDDRRFIQVFMRDGVPVEAAYVERVAVFYPTNQDEFEQFFSDGEENVLGFPGYSLKREDLMGVGYSEDDLRPMFGDAESLDFDRADGTDGYARALSYGERRFDDEDGEMGVVVDVHLGMYARTLPSGDNELLMILAERQISRNGDPAKDIRIEYMAGLILDAARLTVQ